METWVLLIVLLVGLLTLQYVKQLWDQRRYPPGPFPLPIIGSLWRVGIGVPCDTLIKIAKEYGNIYTLSKGQLRLVIICGFQNVQEALINRSEHFTGKQVTPFFFAALQQGKPLGIIFSNGHIWKQQRQFAVVTMRKLGLGKKGLEHQIEEEARKLVEIVAQKKGQLFNPSHFLINSICNVICALVFGHHFDFEDETFQNLVGALKKGTLFIGSIFHVVYEVFPWLMKQLPGPHQDAISSFKLVHSYVRKEIEEHKEHCLLHDPQDFIDFYLLQIQKLEKKKDAHLTYDEENLVNSIFDLFLAGTETTSTALIWALLVMANYPDIQEKVHKEIEDVFGSAGLIHYQDHKKLPYTNAVIHEIQRLKYGLLAGVQRQCTKDVTISGFLIPKVEKTDTVMPLYLDSMGLQKAAFEGATVILDLRSVLLDPERWETPEQFNPNHFLDKEGHFVPREEFLPFSAGGRMCLGEQLARIELFLFLTNLLRSFRFQPPEGVKKLNQDPVCGLIIQPHPYKICAVPYQSPP